MKDPIERQAAIDAIERNACNTQRAIDAVIGLPSAQQVRTEMSSADDLISRQAAIDALVDENIIDHMDTVYDSELHRCKRAIVRILSQLPSAQPEIVRCKDCIKRDYCRTTNIWAVPPDDDWYCGDAERRTDEN